MRFAILLQSLLAIFALGAPRPRPSGLIPNIVADEFYNVPEAREPTRIKHGFRDLRIMALEVMNAPEKAANRIDVLKTVFLKYFLESDESRVTSVIQKLAMDAEKSIRVVSGDDSQEPCQDSYIQAALVTPITDSQEPEIMICTQHRIFAAGDIRQENKPGTLTSKTFKGQIVPEMKPLGGYIIDAVVPWKAFIGEDIRNYIAGPYAVTKILDKNHAVHNADSYAWYLVEAYWAMKAAGLRGITDGKVYKNAAYDPDYDVVFENPSEDSLTSPFSVVFDGNLKKSAQFQTRLGFHDVRLMSSTIKDAAIAAAEGNRVKERLLFDVYNKYFDGDEFTKTMHLFAQVIDDTSSIGRNNTIRVEGKEYDNEQDTRCSSGKTDVFLYGDPPDSHPRMLVCPSVFSMKALSDLTCADFPKNSEVTHKMRPLGFYVLRELMRWKPFVQGLSDPITDQVHGPYGVTHLDAAKALRNAESYAWFATEAHWTLTCGHSYKNAQFDNTVDYTSG